MKYAVNSNSITLINSDSLRFIKTLPDDCIDLIATDRPYYRVKSCAWDNQWAKSFGSWGRTKIESLRSFFSSTERIIFAEHYSGTISAKSLGTAGECVNLKPNVFSPLINYLL